MKTMESFMKMTIHCLSLILTILIIVFLSKRRRSWKTDKPKALPPSPPSLPVVGHLHLLTGGAYHHALESLSRRYGPTFRLQLGRCPSLVVSSPDAVEHCFSGRKVEHCFSGRNDIVFANRPPFMVGDHLSYNFSIVVWASYGGLWRDLTVTALSSRRIDEMARLWEEEIRAVVKEWVVAGSGQVKVDLNAAFLGVVSNLEMRMVCGKRWEDGGPADGELFTPPPLMGPCDFLPALRWVGYGGVERRFVEIQRRRDEYLQAMVDEFRGKMMKEEEGDEGRRKKTTMVEELLLLQKDEPEFYTDKIIKGILVMMFTAGTDTSARTMEWAMSLLLNHPSALHRARAEIDAHIGFTRLVDDSDISKFTYLRCVMYEALRLFPVVPLLIPHLSSSHTTIDGYHVPKDTILLVNAWALHRNPEAWEDPSEFKPERLLGVVGTRDGFRFMPFGAGQRACPGANLAMRIVVLALAMMVQCFEWKKAEEEVFDMEEKAGGITTPKSEPLQAFCTPRRCMAEVLSKLVSTD